MSREEHELHSKALSLAPPQLFQAPDGILNLQEINPDDPVVVSAFLPPNLGIKNGETVYFHIGQDSSASVTITDTDQAIYDATFKTENLPQGGQTYEVYYTFRGQDSKSTEIWLLDPRMDYLGALRHQCNAYGTYPIGVVDAWLVPMAYELAKGGLSIRSIGNKSPSEGPSSLKIFRDNGIDGPSAIGRIEYDTNADIWSAKILQDVNIGRGDFLSIQLMDDDPKFLSFSISI